MSQQQQQQRPVYVPKRKRQRQQQKQPLRLHGAFQGGFSAGYFNTVDTPEGWAPQSQSRAQQQQQSTTNHALQHDGNADYAEGLAAAASSMQQQQQQRPEDFMDEQDHNEWGGPLQVKAAYKTTTTTTKTAATNTAKSAVDSSINDLFSVSVEPKHSKNIGQQLLQRLGWRPNNKDTKNGTASSFTAYIPVDTATTTTSTQHDTKDTHIIRLSNKRLRKIVQSQTAVVVPSPSFQNNDSHVGLGYDAYQNAPEFRRAREQRQRAAQQRARAATTTSQRGAYRVSSVLPGQSGADDFDDEDDHHANQQAAADIAAAETVADFVGRKSTAGFALHDDEDDAYDEDGAQHSSGLNLHAVMGKDAQNQKDDTKKRHKLGVDSETYDTVAYEHNSSSEEEGDRLRKKHAPNAVVNQFGAVLSSWATAKNADQAQQQSKSTVQTMSDGLPPLSGFVVGGTGDAVTVSSSKPYFRGPDVPTDWNYEDRGGHVFFENEHPAVIAALARAEELQATQARQQTAYQQALERAQVKPTMMMTTTKSTIQPHQSKERPQKHSVFAGVGAAMKSRFTSATTTNDNDVKDGQQQQRQQSDADASSDSFFTRTVHPFAPAPLLCKRFGVAALESSSSTAMVVHRTREEAYFEDEILPEAAHAKKQQQQQQARSNNAKNGSNSSKRQTPAQALLEELSGAIAAGDETTAGRIEAAAPNRAVLAVYKSIFEPNSDEQSSSSSSEEEEEGKEDPQNFDRKGSERKVTAESDHKDDTGVAAAASSSTALVLFDEDDDRRRTKGEKRSKNSRSRKRSRSPSRDGKHKGKRKKKKEERKKEDRKQHRRREKKSKQRNRRSNSGSSKGSVRERRERG